MLLSIEYRGQLALSTESPKIKRDVQAGTAVAEVLKSIAADETERFRELVLDSDGECGSTLFVAIDGEHIRLDSNATVPDGAREMIIMPPIAGG